MRKKMRNWLLAGLAIAVFILGVPLVQYVFAGSASPVRASENPDVTAPKAESDGAGPRLIKVGDQYLRVVPMKDESVSFLLYDSGHELIAGNANEGVLSFALPDGTSRTVRIAVATASCTMEEHSPGSAECCSTIPGSMPHEACPHEQEAGQ